MVEITIRIYFRDENGSIEDGERDCGIGEFGGVLPSTGDLILNPGVLSGLDRGNPEHREIWVVVGRFFNPRDNQDYVALIVEVRQPTFTEYELLPGS
jgi:hypothetical protein